MAIMEGLPWHRPRHNQRRWAVFAPPAEFYKAKTALLEAFPRIELEVQEIIFLPQATKLLSGEDLATFEGFLGMLNDCDEMQEIYHNVSIP